MLIFLFVLLGWFSLYWMPGLIMLILMVRKEQDINIEDFIAMVLITALMGPFLVIKEWIEQAHRRKVFDKVLIKKCTKREVWEALGGDIKDGP